MDKISQILSDNTYRVLKFGISEKSQTSHLFPIVELKREMFISSEKDFRDIQILRYD